MSEAATTAAAVLPSAQPATRTSPKKTVRQSVKKTVPKKIRANGTVKTTILLEPWMDAQLSGLAFAWKSNRSLVAIELLKAKLEAYDVDKEITKAAAAYARKPASDGEEHRVEPSGGARENGDIEN
jgi:hypothetical protein